MLHSFPDTEVYLINWLGGACGAFITTLLQDLVSPLPMNKEISINGNSHSNLIPLYQNWDTDSNDTYFDDLHFNKDPIHDYVFPKDPNKVLILYDHILPNWERLFNIFPKCKNLIITIDDDDAELVCGNLFFKNTIECFPGTLSAWNNLKAHHNCLKVYDSPYDISTNDVETFVREYASGLKIESFYSVKATQPTNVFSIPLKDIYSNPLKVIKTLSEASDRVIENNQIEWYNQYLTKQQELLTTKMPWLVDKYPITLLPINNSTTKA